MVSGVTATTNQSERGAPASLDFDVIDARVRKILKLKDDARIFDADVAGVVGSSRESISRYRNGRMIPSFDTARDIAAALGLTTTDIEPKTAGAAA